jgi:hypothetical protein
MEKLSNFLTHTVTIYTFIIGTMSGVIAIYVAYSGFLVAIENNQKQIEITQMMILKPLVREAEKNLCPVSDAEWDEYLMNGSTLQDLKQKHKLISKDIPFVPIMRIKERSKECINIF